MISLQPGLRPDIPTMLKRIKPYISSHLPLPAHDAALQLEGREARVEEKEARLEDRRAVIAKREQELLEKEKELAQRERLLAGKCKNHFIEIKEYYFYSS